MNAVETLFSLCQGRLLDFTKNYMYVFLLAGIEVVLSALVLAICNFLFIKKKPEAPEAAVEAGKTVKAKNHSCTPPIEEPHKTSGNSKKPKNTGDPRPESVVEDSTEVETFLKVKDGQKMNVTCSPESDL